VNLFAVLGDVGLKLVADRDSGFNAVPVPDRNKCIDPLGGGLPSTGLGLHLWRDLGDSDRNLVTR
jgi:hypothetical protein